MLINTGPKIDGVIRRDKSEEHSLRVAEPESTRYSRVDRNAHG